MITPQDEANAQQLQFTDPNKEFLGRFVLTPDITDEADFSHIDKNSIITHLRETPKVEYSEVEWLRQKDEGLHVLNNVKNFKTIEVLRPIGYTIIQNDKGEEIRNYVYEKKKEEKSLFPLTFHFLKAQRYSFVISASARRGYRFDKSRTNILEKSETLQDKTEVNTGIFGFGKKKEGGT